MAPCVRITFRDHAIERGRDGLVFPHGFQARFIRPQHADALARGRKIAFRRRHLRFRLEIARANLIHFLLRHQARFSRCATFSMRVSERWAISWADSAR